MSASNHLDLPEADRCAFCDYLSGRRPYTVVLRSSEIAVLITREQRGIPHLLVLPLKHRETLLDLTDREAAEVLIAAKYLAIAIDAAYQRPGITLWQNNGIPASQSIGHMHLHVAGTIPEGGTNWGDVPELTIAETDAVAAKLKPYIQRNHPPDWVFG